MSNLYVSGLPRRKIVSNSTPTLPELEGASLSSLEISIHISIYPQHHKHVLGFCRSISCQSVDQALSDCLALGHSLSFDLARGVECKPFHSGIIFAVEHFGLQAQDCEDCRSRPGSCFCSRGNRDKFCRFGEKVQSERASPGIPGSLGRIFFAR